MCIIDVCIYLDDIPMSPHAHTSTFAVVDVCGVEKKNVFPSFDISVTRGDRSVWVTFM